jgi:hypothetical protein
MAISNNSINITNRNIVDEMRNSYINYAMSVIVARALPDVRDGLKPVHRRVLFGMSELGVLSNKPYKKSARIVGEVLGKYHPHGDTSVYDAMVRMAQPWSMGHTLVDGQGNFGSIDGDNPAAMRYTECRMESITNELLEDILGFSKCQMFWDMQDYDNNPQLKYDEEFYNLVNFQNSVILPTKNQNTYFLYQFYLNNGFVHFYYKNQYCLVHPLNIQHYFENLLDLYVAGWYTL